MYHPRKVDDSLIGRTEDMLRAFRADAFLSSLSLALTLPDICGVRLFPKKPSSERYALWFNRYVASNYLDDPNEEGEEAFYFDGDDCYQLRCVFLHEGINAPHIERHKTVYNVAQFRVFDGHGCDNIEQNTSYSPDESVFRQVNLDMTKFIEAIASGVRSFVEQYPELNEVAPITGPEKVFYSPILDFRAQ